MNRQLSQEEIDDELARIYREADELNNAPMPAPEFFGDDEHPASGETPTPGDAAQSGPRVLTALDVVTQWEAEGPLAHMPTGFPTLDERTGGGPVEGCRMYILGAPNAWKTAILAQLADVYEAQDCAIGFLCVDEEPGDLVTRFLQRRRWQRRDCEIRDPMHLQRMKTDAAAMSLRIYGDEHTIESAAEDLAANAAGKRPVFFVDSIQTVRAAATTEESTPREAVTGVVRAVRAMSTKHRMLIVATSEMNRAAYRNVDSADQTNDMASGKESGAVEYSARLMLALRSVKGHHGVIEVRVPKNKLGPDGEPFFLQGEHAHMTIVECEAPEAPQKAGAVDVVREHALALVKLLLATPGIGMRQLTAKVKAAGLKIGKLALDAALEFAVDEGMVEDRPVRRGKVTDHRFFAVSPAEEEAQDGTA